MVTTTYSIYKRSQKQMSDVGEKKKKKVANTSLSLSSV